MVFGKAKPRGITTDHSNIQIAKIDHMKVRINREGGKETQRTRMRDGVKYNMCLGTG
jgi:hypothetical protein